MVYQIAANTWFDSEKLFIVKGEEKKQKYLECYDSYPDVKEAKKNENRYPVLTFLSSEMCLLLCRSWKLQSYLRTEHIHF